MMKGSFIDGPYLRHLKLFTTSYPACFNKSADTALSTPPDIPHATLALARGLQVVLYDRRDIS